MTINQHTLKSTTHVRVKQAIYLADGTLVEKHKSINAAKRRSRELSLAKFLVRCADVPPAKAS